MVTLTGSPFKGNQLKAETGKIVHFWLLVVLLRIQRPPRHKSNVERLKASVEPLWTEVTVESYGFGLAPFLKKLHQWLSHTLHYLLHSTLSSTLYIVFHSLHCFSLYINYIVGFLSLCSFVLLGRVGLGQWKKCDSI